jgi:abequosyltransferase
MRLSICIPTYNFGPFIGATLESLVPQMTNDVEVIIVDGASTDNTSEVIHQASQRIPRLTYHRRDRNMGLDEDLAKAVELATGDYCWLLSSDDVPKADTVARILHELEYNCDVYLFNRVECDRALKPLRIRPWLSQTYDDHTFEWNTESGASEYLRAARSLGALFSYISSIVVSRRKWNSTPCEQGAVGTNYAHVIRLLTGLRSGGTIRYVRDALIYCRGSNDSFARDGLIPRLLLDFRGYEHAMATAFPNNTHVHELIRTVVRREHPWLMLARVRARVEGDSEWKLLRQCLARYGYGTLPLWMVEVCSPLMKTLRRVKLAAVHLRSQEGKDDNTRRGDALSRRA